MITLLIKLLIWWRPPRWSQTTGLTLPGSLKNCLSWNKKVWLVLNCIQYRSSVINKTLVASQWMCFNLSTLHSVFNIQIFSQNSEEFTRELRTIRNTNVKEFKVFVDNVEPWPWSIAVHLHTPYRRLVKLILPDIQNTSYFYYLSPRVLERILQ